MADTASGASPRRSSDSVLRAISVFKLLKSILLVCLGVGAFRFLNPTFEQRVTHWVGSVAWSHDRGIVLWVLNKITGMKAIQLKELGIGSFLYATLFAVEGVGLWLEKRWAEYLTLLATCSLLPFEAYELIKQASITRGTVLIVNLIIVLYLAKVVRKRVV